ncbi:alpha/beta hydrolase fold domain-containing protein [Aquirufa nivalisilvae]
MSEIEMNVVLSQSRYTMMKLNAIKLISWGLYLFVILQANSLLAQASNRVLNLFPAGTILHANIPFAQDTLKKHLLDIYLPANTTGKIPLVVFIHGGGWLVNDKYADMGYMGNTLTAMINRGFAVASIDYRWASQAIFPAQIQDCYQALTFLCEQADKYHLDKNRIAIMGFSAGGHLASLVGLANNNKLPEFFMKGKAQKFNIKAVVDFYGPSDLTGLESSDDPKAPEAILLGAVPIERPDLAKKASPVSYVDAQDPPFLIIHGEKDKSVNNKQSKLLSGWLSSVAVKNELIIVKDAPHFGRMFDTEELKSKVLTFLENALKP